MVKLVNFYEFYNSRSMTIFTTTRSCITQSRSQHEAVFKLTQVQVRVHIWYELLNKSEAHLPSLIQTHTLLIQLPLKFGENCEKGLNVLQKFTPLSNGMLHVAVDVKIVSYLFTMY